jgi:solute carrier family 25 citrate transporter 1
MSQSRRESPLKEIYKSMMYGSVAGTAEVIANHPFWTAKTRKQNKLPFTVNLKVLYRGIIPNAMSMAPITAIQTSMFQVMKMMFAGSSTMTSSQTMACAFMAGVGAASIACPTELLMTIQGKHGSFYGAGQYVVKNSGWKGIYAGFTATALRDGIFTAGYLAGSPLAKAYVQSYIKSELAAGIVGGIIAGLCATIASQAIDTIKTEQQSGEVKQRIGMIAASKKIISTSGMSGLYSGGMWRGARVVSAVTIMSVLNEQLKAKFG